MGAPHLSSAASRGIVSLTLWRQEPEINPYTNGEAVHNSAKPELANPASDHTDQRLHRQLAAAATRAFQSALTNINTVTENPVLLPFCWTGICRIGLD